MTKRMLIDAIHPEETRVVVCDEERIYDFDSETSIKKQLKGNIYLAKVSRVEPSLQAVFVEYGGNRHGFLPFSEIHPDYFRIPVEDVPDEAAEEQSGDDKDDVETSEENEEITTINPDEDIFDEIPQRSRRLYEKYKVQEVIQKRQIMLIQIVKEERGNKGAALTTYLSIPGRYCVLMPNTPDSGGISRKITNPKTRKRLRTLLDGLSIPEGVSVIIRTAGMERTKTEVKRDYEYLMRLWTKIRQLTLESVAPNLIYEEDDLIKRSVRDLYSRDIDEILIEGEEAYKSAKNLMKLLMPSHAKRVQKYKDDLVPLFHRHNIERQLLDIHNPEVELRSGGTIVINPTEALVSVDVNSARSTKLRHIDDTALTTNLEAAEEVARQLRLRDLGGLVVIDFIDMQEDKHNAQVERKLREALKSDRARIQVGKISMFGLLEMSRQRLRPSILEISSIECHHCDGIGRVRSKESVSLAVLRSIEEIGIKNQNRRLKIVIAAEVALYILNHKRKFLSDIETKYGLKMEIEVGHDFTIADFELNLISDNQQANQKQNDQKQNRNKQKQQQKKGKPQQKQNRHKQKQQAEDSSEAKPKQPQKHHNKKGKKPFQKQGNKKPHPQTEASEEDKQVTEENVATEQQGNEKPKRQPNNKRRRGPMRRKQPQGEKQQQTPEVASDTSSQAEEPKAEQKKKPQRKTAPKKAVAKTEKAEDSKPAEDTKPMKPAAKKKPAPKKDSAEKTEAPKKEQKKEPTKTEEPKKPKTRRKGWWQKVAETS